VKEKLDKFEVEIAKIKEQVNELFQKKNDLREDYYKDKLAFETEKDEINQIEWMAREKQKIIDREENKKKRIEERKQMLKDRPNPYEKEIETCEHLISFCNRVKLRHGLGDTTNDDELKDS